MSELDKTIEQLEEEILEEMNDDSSVADTEEELDEMNIKSPDDEIAESSPEDAS